MPIIFKALWERVSQPPPFKVDEPFAVNFMNAVLDGSIGTRIQHSVALSEAVVVQICSLLSGKDAGVARPFHSSGLPAAYVVLSSLLHSQRVPVPGTNALQML
eukprot:6178394-Pleurochrysis_carterae.AAC.1